MECPKIIGGINYVFAKDNTPIATVKEGELLQFDTQDCFGCQIRTEEQLVTEIDYSKANPTAGPVYVEGAEVGDVLVVEIVDIQVDTVGIACTIPGMGVLCDVTQTRTRLFALENGKTSFNGVEWDLDPMIGVIGTAPAEGAIPTALAGDHGGNLDSNRIRKGTRVYLPVRAPGALLQMGDLHATMGDGELCGTGIETSGHVLVTTRVIKNFPLRWIATETEDKWFVNPVNQDYEVALVDGCVELTQLAKAAYGWDETDVAIYLSVQGFVEVNQSTRPASRGGMVRLRVGLPKLEDKPLIQ